MILDIMSPLAGFLQGSICFIDLWERSESLDGFIPDIGHVTCFPKKLAWVGVW